MTGMNAVGYFSNSLSASFIVGKFIFIKFKATLIAIALAFF